MDLGRALRYYREINKYTQWEISSKAGVNEKYYGRIERNESSPTINKVEMICEALDMEVSCLIKKAEEIELNRSSKEYEQNK